MQEVPGLGVLWFCRAGGVQSTGVAEDRGDAIARAVMITHISMHVRGLPYPGSGTQ
jgi:hypothetical protein